MLRKAHRATVLPGFPARIPFSTNAEIEAYLTGEKIQCLLCGKMFKDVGKHVSAQHRIPPDEYRSRYGIPWGRGLCCAESSMRYSETVAKRLEDPQRREALLGFAAKARAKLRTDHPAHRPFVTATLRPMIDRVLAHPARVFDKCHKCSAEVPDAKAPSLCDACRVSDKPQYRREKALKSYYKDVDKSRRLLRERAKRYREKVEL
jgi:hypothetical protein